MQTIALHTRLKPGSEQTYEAVHRAIPDDLASAIRSAGAREAEMAERLDIQFTYSDSDAGPPMVWSLAGQVDL